MKKVLLLTSLVFCLSAHASAQTATPANSPAVKVETPKFLPDEVTGRELRDLSGRAFRLSDLRGRVYVVNLWATWCPPCRMEIPGLNKVYEDYRARGVEFVGLTAEDPNEDSEKVREFVGELKMSYRIGWLDADTGKSLMAWNAARPGSAVRYSIPQTFVVAADGHVVLRLRGYNLAVPDMVRAGVRKALDLAPAQTPTAQPGAAGHP